jgi:4'-phosphopantetheinyl transferase
VHHWPDAPPDLTPPPAGTVRCWRIPIATIGEALPRVVGLLDASERQRLGRFHRVDDGRRFVAAHAGLRVVLAAALGRDARALTFQAGAHGKPALVDGGVQFNLSHSGTVALVALAADVALGVDVEEMRPLPERRDIVEHYLHPDEAADLNSLDGAAAEQAFYRAWTRKEALTKALGLGLNLDLDRFRVSCRPGESPAVRALDGFDPPPSDWSIADLDPAPGHVGAIALPLRPMRLCCRTLDVVAWLRTHVDRDR